MTSVLVFDSGVGGLSVAREIRLARPDTEMIYVADDAGFPYGALDEAALVDRVVGVIAGLVARYEPSVVVVACNTASTLVLGPLRERFSLPFVGTVPAIKPAAEQTRTGLVSVLATPGTIRRDYTRGLIESFAAACHVRLVGCPELAAIAETRMRGKRVDEAAVKAEIAPAFVDQDGARTDVVVLACTHYPFIAAELAQLAPWPVRWIDPASAIARRVVAVSRAGGEGGGVALRVSGASWHPRLEPFLENIGLVPQVTEPLTTMAPEQAGQ
ncbi:glutamate racemase [Bauldia sp.]|uniref:glutamate racemase n=1 Tax=Bauldia sp. TaxID=2575872 RepID=UPI003BADBD01